MTMAETTAAGGGARAGSRAAHELRQRSAEDVVHHEQQLPAGRDDVERRDHVGVLHARGEPRLVEEHRDELGVGRQVRVQALDGHGPREADGPDDAAQVDDRHPPRGDRVVHLVATDTVRHHEDIPRARGLRGLRACCAGR